MNVSNNLKSNFFDKMLSNEMLSIKQHIYEKDSSYGSTVYLTFRNSVQTPTLEIKQKWLLEKSLVMPNNNITLENFTSFSLGTNKPIVKPRKKAIEHEKRNLDDIPSDIDEETFLPDIHTTRKLPKTEHGSHCNCTRASFLTTCSRHQSEKEIVSSVKTCFHSTKVSIMKPVSITYYPYYLYSPYFVGVTTDYAYNNYKKHSKMPYNYDIYLEGRGESSYDEDKYKIYGINKYKKKYKKYPKIYSVKYDEQVDTTEATDLSKKLSKSNLKIVNRDEFVNEVVEDLKDYYSDVVIKDCYCSCFKKNRSTTLHFVFIAFYNVIICFVNYI